MNMTFIAKEFRENRWVILATFIILAALTPFYPYSYSSMLAYLLGQGYTYEKFLWYDWFMKAQPQVTLIAAIIIGSTSFAREKKNTTLGILVTKPVSRTKILMNKLVAGSLSLVAILAASTFVLTLTSPMLGAPGMDAGYIAFGLLGDALLIIPVYLLAALLSIVFLNSIKAGLLSAVAMLLLYGPAWLGSNLSVIWWLFNNTDSVNPVAAIALAAAGALFVWLGAIRFKKMEI